MIRNLTHPSTLLVSGGIVASLFLIIVGVGAIVIGYQGRQEVQNSLAQEKIVGTPDSTIAGQLVDTGSEARAFADVMREHTLKSTNGQTYAELGRYLDPDGNPTSDANAAAKGANGKPVENPLRQLWITETALTTALNTAYFAEQVGAFAMVMGAALTLSGFGFAVLTLGALRHSTQPAAAASSEGQARYAA